MTLQEYNETIEYWQQKHASLKAQISAGAIDYDLMAEFGDAICVLSVANEPQRFLQVA